MRTFGGVCILRRMKPMMGLMAVGCATTATTTKSMAETYERKGGGNTSTIVFLENGIAEDYTNGRGPQRRAKWRRKGNKIHVTEQSGGVAVFKINADRSLTHVIRINNGRSLNVPKQYQFTYKNIK